MAIDPNDIQGIKDDAKEIGNILNTYSEKIKESAKILSRMTGESADNYKASISKAKILASELQKFDKEAISSSKGRASLERQMLNLQKEITGNLTLRKNIAAQLVTASDKERKLLLKVLDGLNETIYASKELLDNTKSIASTFIDIEKNLGITGDLLEGINKIPILNKFIDVKKALAAANKEAASLTGNRWSVLSATLGSLGSSLKQNLSDPLVYIGLAVKFFKELVTLGLAFSQRTADIAKNFGISSKEALILNQRLSDITLSSKNVLLTQKSLLEATNQINDAFGTSALLTERTLAGQIDLTKRLGLTGEEAAVYAEYSLRTGKSQEQIVNSIGKQNKGILNNKKVIQDVTKVNGQLYAQYKGSPDLIAKAVIQAQKLGLTLQQTKNISKGLLDFESSIANELEAELITGMDLNLEKARYLALMGDSAGAARELMKNLGPNGLQKFQNMNVLAQESLANAFGMSADELADSLRTQEMLSKLGKEDKTAYKEAIAAARKKGDLDKASALEKQMNQGKEFKLADQQLSAQDRFNTALEKMKGLLASIVEGPLGQMAETIAKMIEGIGKIPGIGKLLGYAAPIAAVIGGGLFVSSLTRGTFFNPTYVRPVGGGLSGGSGGGLGNMFGGNKGGGKTAWGGKPGKIPKGYKFPKGASSIGKLGKLAKGAGALSLLGTGMDLAGNLMDDERSTGNAVAKTLDQNKFLALGAGIGSIVPGVGTAIGAGIGGLADMLLADKTQIVEDGYSPSSKGPFTITDRFGKMAKTTNGDDLYAGPNIDVNKITNVANKSSKTRDYSTPNSNNNNMDFTKLIEAVNGLASKPTNIAVNVDGRQMAAVVVNQFNKNGAVVA
jgi:hypothetical protein